MRPETVKIVLGDQEIIQCEDMTLASDLYDPAGKWSMSLGERVTAKSGARCMIYINGVLELTGVVDSVEETESRGSHSWSVEGVSLAGLLGRSFLTKWTNPPTTLDAAARRLLSEIPYVKSLKWKIEGDDPSKEHAKFDVGDTVHGVLNEFAQNRGLLFWAKPDGSLVFGKAAGKGEADYFLDSSIITMRRRREDGSNLHSEVHIVSDSDEAGHQVYVARNASAPIRLPFAAAYNGHDNAGMRKQAAEYLRQEKLAAEQLNYSVSGFSIRGSNWQINKRVLVDDERFSIKDTLLLRTRTFRYNRKSGSTTDLVLTPILAEDVFKAYPRKRKKDSDS